MKPAPIAHFLRAASAEDASRQVMVARDAAVIIAGGQSLVPMLALRVAPADTLIHVGRIDALRGVTPIAGGVRIGAAVTHAEIEDGKIGSGAGVILKRVAAGIAYRAVRNHGTIGGSMGLADPAADWPVALLALDARVNITGPGGTRVETVDGFLRGAYTTSLTQGEIITSFDVPEPAMGTRFGYVKVARKSGAFAMSIGCVVRRPGQGVSVVVGGMQQRAWRLAGAEHVAAGSSALAEDLLRAAIAADLAKAEPDTDAYQLRLHMATVLKALREAG
jgi:aerobic carbon-monoxide dehydrogenase medium subunit